MSRLTGASFRRADKVLGTLSDVAASARRNVEELHRLSVESDFLLAQAAAFARGGDYLGAQARARFADQRVVLGAATLRADDPFVIATRARVGARIRHYDSLASAGRTEVEARHLAYIGRERQALLTGRLPS